ncbi:hypothetical protein ACP70R_006469 [Stipagrostis hirtigluma subsp. patula]
MATAAATVAEDGRRRPLCHRHPPIAAGAPRSTHRHNRGSHRGLRLPCLRRALRCWLGSELIVTKKKNNKLTKKKFKENVEEAKLLRRKVNANEGEQRCTEAIERAVLDSSAMQPKELKL